MYGTQRQHPSAHHPQRLMTLTSLQHQRGIGSHQHGDGTGTSCGPRIPRGIDSDVPTYHHSVATWGRTGGPAGPSAGGILHPMALMYSHPHAATCHGQGGQETGVMESLEGQQLPLRLARTSLGFRPPLASFSHPMEPTQHPAAPSSQHNPCLHPPSQALDSTQAAALKSEAVPP